MSNRHFIIYFVIVLGLSLLLGFQSATGKSLAAHPPDPGDPGPFAVTQDDYSFPDVELPEFPNPVEVRARVFYPTDLTTGAPYPLIVVLHGKYPVCHNGTRTQPPKFQVYDWPCRRDYPYPLWSYQGYGDATNPYLGGTLASHGYIVVSISANAINASDIIHPGREMRWRAKLIQHHLDYWNTCNSGSCNHFGNLFTGKVNLQRVGTIGHSRGGEAVVHHYFYNRDEPGLPNRYGIAAVMGMVPTNSYMLELTGVPVGVLLSYCDANVYTLEGAQYFDRGRYSSSNSQPRHKVLVMGANHNYYNTVWTQGPGSFGCTLGQFCDDWVEDDVTWPENERDPYCGTQPGNQRLDPPRQRASGLAYISAFVRTYASSNTEPSQYQFIQYLTGDSPPPSSAQGATIYASYHAPQGSKSRYDLNQLVDELNLERNTLGGAVTRSNDFAPYRLCGGPSPQPVNCLPRPPYDSYHEPHTVHLSQNRTQPGLSQLDGGWTSRTTWYKNDIPPGQGNVSGFEVLQFRASVNFGDPSSRNIPGVNQDFTVRLNDHSGGSASLRVSDVYGSRPYPLYYPPGGISPPHAVPVPHIILNTIRMPLSGFIGVNLGDIQSVEFRFDQRDSGALLISDIVFANSPSGGGPPPPPATPTPTPCPIYFADVPTPVGRETPTPVGYTVYFHNIRCLACPGVISGNYGVKGQVNPCNGSPEDPNLTYFYPCIDVTRGHVTKFVSNAAGFYDEISPNQQTFQDVPPTHPFWLWIERLVKHGVVVGYEGPMMCPGGGRCYRPSEAATRQQVMKMVAVAAGLNDRITQQSYADVPTDHPFYLYIERVKLHGGVGPVGHMVYLCGSGATNPCTGQEEVCDDQCRLYFRPCLPMRRDEATKPNAVIFFPNCHAPPYDELGGGGCKAPQGAKALLTTTATSTTSTPTRTGTPTGSATAYGTASVAVTGTAPMPSPSVSPTATSWVPTPVQTAPPPVPTEQQHITPIAPKR